MENNRMAYKLLFQKMVQNRGLQIHFSKLNVLFIFIYVYIYIFSKGYVVVKWNDAKMH